MNDELNSTLKILSYCIISAVLAVTVLWSINELSILAGVQKSQDPEDNFILPVCLIYLSLSLFLVYPATFFLSKKIGNIKAGILSSITLALIIGAILYNPEVDRFSAIIIIPFFISLPWFVGGLLGKYIINIVWKKNDT